MQRFSLFLSLLRQREFRVNAAVRHRNARRRLACYLHRRRLISSLFYLLLTQYIQQVPIREVWRKPRSNSFWQETCGGWADREWIENLRMSREAFDYLCNELSPYISKRDTNYRKAIPVRERVAITLYRLADTAPYRTVANLFGVGKSTVCTIVKEVCLCIINVLLPRFIRLPNGRQEIDEEIEGFWRRAGFPQVIGAVDGCHIAIIAPEENAEDFVNRKGFHSVVLQGLVDSDYLFRDICVGWPGRVHDSRIFKNSPLYEVCCGRTFLPLDASKLISGVAVPPLILGDSAYGLYDWLMKPFSDCGNLSQEQVKFNNVHSITRVVVENAFGRLKGRFRSIGKRLDLNVENSCVVISACCVLHNYCELRKEEFDDQWLDSVQLHIGVNPADREQVQNRNAVAIRNAITSHIALL